MASAFTRTADMQIPGNDPGCRWIAVQAQPGRASTSSPTCPGSTATGSTGPDLLHQLANEARRIKQEVRLTPLTTQPTRQHTTDFTPTASDQLAAVLTQLADEQSGPLATVRGLVGHTTHRVVRQPGTVRTPRTAWD
ncbi:hypothetical protein [Streptomyces sp. NPDC003247]|uniref:hypothetical protein n=1 Tax=Streptomyces sp. NPDC003247 TaxID=3364677 RepID=UPI0036C4553E